MGFAKNLLRAAVGLPIPKPAVPKPPRSLGVRIVLGTFDVLLGGAATKPPNWRCNVNENDPSNKW